jgi:hypothetical protein
MSPTTLVAPSPDFGHLARMTDHRGLFEHADHTTPRRDHGYCTDDVARLLVVTSREPDPDPVVGDLAATALQFLLDAQGETGDCHNRMDVQGHWQDDRTVDDCWGRSLWGFGTAAARHPDHTVRHTALAHFERGAEQRSPWPRAMAFAALGASEVVAAYAERRRALALLSDAAKVIGQGRGAWRWPEPRLSYANAVLPEALIAAGNALKRESLQEQGLALLWWLLDQETVDGHLSVTPVGGRGPDDPRPGYDQQPIEVAALADACARAAKLTASGPWNAGLAAAVAWFLGDNDAGCAMWDPSTGGGYDGLQATGPNLNQGAESTLALVSTLQHARRLTPIVPLLRASPGPTASTTAGEAAGPIGVAGA